MKPSTVLTKAKKLIEKGWCRGPAAKNARGEAVDPLDESACRWCMSGALDRALGYDRVLVVSAEDRYLSAACGVSSNPWSYITFNEAQTSKRPVLRAFDRAIKLAKSEGK